MLFYINSTCITHGISFPFFVCTSYISMYKLLDGNLRFWTCVQFQLLNVAIKILRRTSYFISELWEIPLRFFYYWQQWRWKWKRIWLAKSKQNTQCTMFELPDDDDNFWEVRHFNITTWKRFFKFLVIRKCRKKNPWGLNKSQNSLNTIQSLLFYWIHSTSTIFVTIFCSCLFKNRVIDRYMHCIMQNIKINANSGLHMYTLLQN